MSDRKVLGADIMRDHRATWWVYAGSEKIRHTATMRGHWPGWDVTCRCGWQTRTGGAIRRSVEDDLFAHRWSAKCAAERAKEES